MKAPWNSRKDFGVKHWPFYRWMDVLEAVRGKMHKTMTTDIHVASDRLIDHQRKLEKKR